MNEIEIETEAKTYYSEDLLDSESRKRYEEACYAFDEQIKPLARAVNDSERLTKDDYAIRINAR